MRVLDRVDPDEIADLRKRGEFFWLDVVGDEQVEEIERVFKLHPLVIEDMREPGQRPKLDDYEDYMLLVFYGAEPGDSLKLIEVECVISGDYVITHRDDSCAELDGLRKFFTQRDARDEQFVVYRVLDGLTDSFFPVLASIDDEIDDLENDVIEQPTDEQLQRIFRLKRDLVAMRKVITPQRDIFARAADQIIELRGLEKSGARDYFRDVYDHLIRISDLIDSYRDLLTGAMDVYLSTVSNRLNVVMKQLTIIATIFLPLTVVTGFFGQNFGWLVDHIKSVEAFLAYGIGGLIASCLILFVWFRRSGFLSS
jgi:magnesium transporter